MFQDGGGHVRLILGNSQAVVWEAMYKPYGHQVVLTGTSPNPFRFVANEQRDAIGGLQYMHARWYNPMMGQFYTRDPIEAGGGHTMRPNLCTYGLANPKTYGDKYGDNPLALAALAVGVVYGVGTGLACWAMGHENCLEEGVAAGVGAGVFTLVAGLLVESGPFVALPAAGAAASASSYLACGAVARAQGKPWEFSWEEFGTITAEGAAMGFAFALGGYGLGKLWNALGRAYGRTHLPAAPKGEPIVNPMKERIPGPPPGTLGAGENVVQAGGRSFRFSPDALEQMGKRGISMDEARGPSAAARSNTFAAAKCDKDSLILSQTRSSAHPTTLSPQ